MDQVFSNTVDRVSAREFTSKTKSQCELVSSMCYMQGKGRFISGDLSSSDFGATGRALTPNDLLLTTEPFNDSALITFQCTHRVSAP